MYTIGTHLRSHNHAQPHKKKTLMQLHIHTHTYPPASSGGEGSVHTQLLCCGSQSVSLEPAATARREPSWEKAQAVRGRPLWKSVRDRGKSLYSDL